MGWTSLFLNMEKKKVLILGSGEVGQRRALKFLDAHSKVIITGGTVPEKLLKLGALEKPVNELEKWIEWADLVVVASGDNDLNAKAAALGKNKLLNRADYPLEGNIIVPTSFSVGDAQISIFTGGKSPLMARMLRKKIQEAIKDADLLQIELQHYARQLLKDRVIDQKKRRVHLYQIFNNPEIIKLLNEGELKEAKSLVRKYLNKINGTTHDF
ncbi:MAG: bifunctional precorrin-2 dehydrogenase/sirohydrochlorin ferrochelatase [Euryarchaeota archaeon]|nr:bifunctional precorrin-2 dehydrogenase/sirohydrochlorin ferrochelatase [Euryarchaeota archaeon]MBU4608467.1 bifunctional precorrin-2 dehydrogenase/sirohydrochlorin ferrochelatase [Euryarchaeota archaeon]MBV1755306.1 bifunctional precorrin-2 dehydrogenase/sirohydrochlorin ferrochelatase [Methanobacterium sp.]